MARDDQDSSLDFAERQAIMGFPFHVVVGPFPVKIEAEQLGLRILGTLRWEQFMRNSWQPRKSLPLGSMLPATRNHWRQPIDTSLRSPSPIIESRNARPVESPAYLVRPQPLVMYLLKAPVRLRADARSCLSLWIESPRKEDS
jgi:hypothetical protein